MAITRMTVIKASSDADYRKGQDIFLIDKRIKNFETDINTLTGTPMITATVLDADGSEHETQVSIDEDESQIVGSLCRYPFEIYLQTTYSNKLSGKETKSDWPDID